MDTIGAWTALCQVQESGSSIIDLSIDENIIGQMSLECHLASASPQPPVASGHQQPPVLLFCWDHHEHLCTAGGNKG